METTNEFAATCAAMERAQAHAQEIKATRVGGLGGSDAAILHKIGQYGLSALSMTDHKRLAIMLGKIEQSDWSGNEYTNAGHAFEDWSAKYINGEREVYMSAELARNFKTFAHADFIDTADNANPVIECKFVQMTTDKVINKYYSQLQWYYLLGAKKVLLFHGIGTAEPFDVEETFLRKIERDDAEIDILRNGIRILDEALSNGWSPEVADKIAVQETPGLVQEAFERLEEIKNKKKVLDDMEKDAKKVLIEYIKGFGLTSIFVPETKRQVVYVRESEVRTFDVAKFAAEHPELDLSAYYKVTKRAASITFK